jgi:hypothetical protein
LNKIEYLAGVFGLLNQTNNSLPGHSSDIIDLHDKIKCFPMKADLWFSKLKGKTKHMFLILADNIEESSCGTGWNESLLSEIKVH